MERDMGRDGGQMVWQELVNCGHAAHCSAGRAMGRALGGRLWGVDRGGVVRQC